MVQLTRHIACTWTVQDIWSIAIGHGIHALSIKTKEKSGLRTPRTALYKSVGGAKQRTFEHTFVSTTASHSEYQRFKDVWTTRQATMATPNLGIHAYMHVSCVKKSYFASFVPKTCSLFLLSFFDLGEQNPSSLKVKWSGSDSITLQIQPQQLARFELRSQQNTFTWRHAWLQPLWRHLLSNQWHKTLISRLLGMYLV